MAIRESKYISNWKVFEFVALYSGTLTYETTTRSSNCCQLTAPGGLSTDRSSYSAEMRPVKVQLAATPCSCRRRC